MDGEVANHNARRQRGIVHCGRCGAEGVTVRSCPTCRHLPRARIDNAADIAVNVVPPLLPGQAHLENLNAAIRDIDGDELGDENGEYDAPDDEDQLPLPLNLLKSSLQLLKMKTTMIRTMSQSLSPMMPQEFGLKYP